MTAYNAPTAAPEVAAQLNRRTAQLLEREREIARLLEQIKNLKRECQILSYLVAEKETRQ
jgi:flagellar motility protein MotE (MotC chaperone)